MNHGESEQSALDLAARAAAETNGRSIGQTNGMSGHATNERSAMDAAGAWQQDSPKEATRILVLSSVGFTLLFAVWLMFGVLGIPIREEFGLSDVELGWLTAAAILNGSLWRLAFGIMTDRLGGRRVFTALLLFTAIPTFLVTTAGSFTELVIYAFLLGIAGNSFNVGISWNSAWTPRHRQGFALGVFGAGNVGASVTKLIGPGLIAMIPAAGLFGGFIPSGWRFMPVMYTFMLVAMATLMWTMTPRVDRKPAHGRPLRELLRPLRHTRVWRFSLYYVVVFGAYVALSAWLPKYYVDVFGLQLRDAALLTALFIFPASLLRPLGGWLSDKLGARRVMYWVFGTMSLALIALSVPNGHVVLQVPEKISATGTIEALHFSLGVVPFTIAIVLLGVGMGIGKAAVYKHIPEYFPKDVGAVGGLVGLIGALGGFALPPLFAYAVQWTGLPTSTFGIMLLITLMAFAWMHVTILRMVRKAAPAVAQELEVRGSESR